MSACETQPDFREVKKLKASGAPKKKKKTKKTNPYRITHNPFTQRKLLLSRHLSFKTFYRECKCFSFILKSGIIV